MGRCALCELDAIDYLHKLKWHMKHLTNLKRHEHHCCTFQNTHLHSDGATLEVLVLIDHDAA